MQLWQCPSNYGPADIFGKYKILFQLDMKKVGEDTKNLGSCNEATEFCFDRHTLLVLSDVL